MKRLKAKNLLLWGELKKGNLDALGKIYDQFVDDLFSYGMQIVSDKDIVMDCIHDLFLDLYKYKAKLASPNNIKHYLLISLKRKIIKKAAERRTLLSIDTSFQEMEKEYYSKSFEEETIDAEFIDERNLKLVTSLKLLSKKQKLALFLRFNEDREYEEIARIMKVSVQTSRTTIYRAIKVLRSALASIVFFFV